MSAKRAMARATIICAATSRAGGLGAQACAEIRRIGGNAEFGERDGRRSRSRWRGSAGPWTGGVLCRIARWNRPRGAGIVSRHMMACAPADWPMTVTRAGSPPNAAMCSRTHARAAIMSSRAQLPSANAGVVQEAERAEAVVDADRRPHRRRARGCAPSYQSSEPAPLRYAPPCSHTITGRLPASAAGVAMVSVRQSSILRPGEIAHRCAKARWRLRSNRAVRAGIAHALPRQRRGGRARSGVRRWAGRRRARARNTTTPSPTEPCKRAEARRRAIAHARHPSPAGSPAAPQTASNTIVIRRSDS